MIRDKKISEYLEKTENLEETVNYMTDEAIANGGPDNISIVLGKITTANTHDT
jgi:serine/threonine protein phosphatase PrpC